MGAKEAKFSFGNWIKSMGAFLLAVITAFVGIIVYVVSIELNQSYYSGRLYEMKGEIMVYQKNNNDAQIKIASLQQQVEDQGQRISRLENKMYGEK